MECSICKDKLCLVKRKYSKSLTKNNLREYLKKLEKLKLGGYVKYKNEYFSEGISYKGDLFCDICWKYYLLAHLI